MLLEEHRLEQVRERHVEAVEPVGLLGAVVAMAVPAPAWSEDDVAGLHRVLVAVDHRVGALRVQDHAQRVRRMAMRARLLPGQDRLVRGDQGAQGGVVVAGNRVAHHEVAPLGAIRADEAPGRLHRPFRLGVTPVRRHEFRAHLGRKDRLFALDPAGRHVARRERLLKLVEAR